jgi:outer membrane protein assembly factor BamB
MRLAFTLGIILTGLMSCHSQGTWTHLRGNKLDGHAEGTDFPVHFSDSLNVGWKTAVPGLGWSSPVVFGNQIWVTAATRDGKKMSAICVDFTSGKIMKELLLFEPDTIQNIHATNSYATPTPCIEDGSLYVHFGTYGTACINTGDFSTRWSRTDLNCQHMQGAASSLLLYRDFLIVHIEGTDVQYIAALDKKTGRTVWKTERPQAYYKDIAPVSRKAYITPLIVSVDGQDQLISNGAQMCIAYDPNTGEERWSVWYGHDSTVGMPLAYNGLVYFNSGWIFLENTPWFVRFFAVDPHGKGDVSKTHVKWEMEEDVPQITTPVIVDGKIYMVHERGATTCVDAMTGKIIWKDKLKGQFNASPISAGGNIYIPEVRGTIYVVKPGDKFQLVAENKLESQIKATPAFVDGSIIIRTEKYLYRIVEMK